MKTSSIIDDAIKKVGKINSYRCIMDVKTWKNGLKSARQRYIYKKPGFIRIEQIGAFNKGAVIVVYPDGRMRAKGGGFLSFMTIDLKKDSKLIGWFTGEMVAESDWHSILQKSKKMRHYVIKSTYRKIEVDTFAAFEIFTALNHQEFDKVHMMIREDGPILLIERFKNNKKITETQWQNIELFPTIDESDFMF